MKEEIGYFDGVNIKDKYDTCISSYLDDINFAKSKFEILSEQDEEIDIEAIEEFPEVDGISSCAPNNFNIQMFGEKCNDLIKAVKQLNNKIQGID